MKIRKSVATSTDKVEMQMTPMIDIVFQLLTFFVMSFKIATVEGDFSIKMPLAAASSAVAEQSFPPITIRLAANQDGGISSITVSNEQMSSFTALRNKIISIVGNESGPGSIREEAEVELDCDYKLKYSYVVEAISAISGYVDQNGHLVKLIDKLKFAPPKNEE